MRMQLRVSGLNFSIDPVVEFASLALDEQPVTLHPLNWLGMSCFAEQAYIFDLEKDLAYPGDRCFISC
jgi:hypothetical protein